MYQSKYADGLGFRLRALLSSIFVSANPERKSERGGMKSAQLNEALSTELHRSHPAPAGESPFSSWNCRVSLPPCPPPAVADCSRGPVEDSRGSSPPPPGLLAIDPLKRPS